MPLNSVFLPADILLPKSEDMSKWATIACDQFSSEPEYWERVKNYVGNSPSTLNMMLPEAWLEGADMEKAADDIGACMDRYSHDDVFHQVTDSYIYIERRLPGGKMRRGIVGALDLDAYNYDPKSGAPVKASENTALDRLPPRIMMREHASLEMPHVMVLIDDPDKTVIDPLSAKTSEMERIYDFELMEGGGHISGYRADGDIADGVLRGLNYLSSKEEAEKKYGAGIVPPLMIIGDGNHSLAAAKACWDEIKPSFSENQRKNHPARFALVEINNLHDDCLEIEPIHRVVFGADDGLIQGLKACVRDVSAKDGDGYSIRYFMGADTGEIVINGLTIGETIGVIQEFIDEYIDKNGGRVDYIHGDDTLTGLSAKDGVAGFYMPAMGKEDLFKSVIMSGIFPKKSFSMGHARDKRYYLELRKIKL